MYGQHRPQNDLAHSCRDNRIIPLRIYVDAYSGYKANERPQQFDLSLRNRIGAGSLVRAVGDILQGPDDGFQGVHTALRGQADEWMLQSRFDGDELLARPAIELVTVDADIIRQAEKLIDGCEHCHEDDADVPFDWILDKITGRNGATTDYILTEPARCPTCKHEITEKTLVEPLD